jgi:RNase P/RNase MRP subunit POP5
LNFSERGAGLIQNERTDVIEVVRDLAVSRISSENTLILVTIPMSGKFCFSYPPPIRLIAAR